MAPSHRPWPTGRSSGSARNGSRWTCRHRKPDRLQLSVGVMPTLDLFGFGAKGWGGQLLAAVGMTLAVTLAAMAIGLVLGALVALAKLSSRRPVRAIGSAYTTVFRGVPELLIIYFVYFGGSSAVTAIGSAFGVQGFFGLPAFIA